VIVEFLAELLCLGGADEGNRFVVGYSLLCAGLLLRSELLHEVFDHLVLLCDSLAHLLELGLQALGSRLCLFELFVLYLHLCAELVLR
jgi:hypothetical protein